jgi:acetyl-CoA C-acetyltransferase
MDPVYVAEHEPMWGSPAMAAASSEALRSAGVGIDDVAHIDLYSCFASSVEFALDALGLRPDDPRGFTVTGGLPYFGGAGSDYMTHSIATMVDVLRREPGAFGLCSGVGMHMTKHVYGVYSTEPPSAAPRPDPATVRQQLDVRPKPEIVHQFAGDATVATYTVLHGRDGGPDWGLVVCDVDDGVRCYGKVRAPAILGVLETDECVGRRVRLANDGEVNEVTAWAS